MRIRVAIIAIAAVLGVVGVSQIQPTSAAWQDSELAKGVVVGATSLPAPVVTGCTYSVGSLTNWSAAFAVTAAPPTGVLRWRLYGMLGVLRDEGTVTLPLSGPVVIENGGLIQRWRVDFTVETGTWTSGITRGHVVEVANVLLGSCGPGA